MMLTSSSSSPAVKFLRLKSEPLKVNLFMWLDLRLPYIYTIAPLFCICCYSLLCSEVYLASIDPNLTFL